MLTQTTTPQPASAFASQSAITHPQISLPTIPMSDSTPSTPAVLAEGDANDTMDGVETGDLAGDLFGETPQEAEETEKEKEGKREEEEAEAEYLREENGDSTALTVIDVDAIVAAKPMTFVE